MHDVGHQVLCITFQFSIGDAQFLNQFRLHRFRIKFLAVDDFLKRVHDFGLHLIGCGIGESDGEDVPEIGHRTFVCKAKLQVFLNERKGLASTS